MDEMTGCRLVWVLAGVHRRHKGEEDAGKSLEIDTGEYHWS